PDLRSALHAACLVGRYRPLSARRSWNPAMPMSRFTAILPIANLEGLAQFGMSRAPERNPFLLAVAGTLLGRRGKPRQHLIYLSVHVSRSCWIGGRHLISRIGLSHDEDAFCLYAALLLVKPRPIE